MAMSLGFDDTQNAEALRRSLIDELDQLRKNRDGEQARASGTDAAALLEDLERDFEEFKNHDILRHILDNGRPVKEFAADVDAQLRAVELESIQEYINETENLVQLHEEVRRLFDQRLEPPAA